MKRGQQHSTAEEVRQYILVRPQWKEDSNFAKCFNIESAETFTLDLDEKRTATKHQTTPSLYCITLDLDEKRTATD